MSQLLWDLVSTIFGKPNEIHIDTQILRLHSRVSCRVFLICSVLLSLRQIIGSDDIMCFDQGQSKDDNLNAYCWVHSTYSVLDLFHKCSVKKDCIYPGVGQLHFNQETRLHKYYQWTSAALCLQAFICYIPRFIWKFFENGLQRNLAYDRKLLFYPLIPNDEEDDGYKTHLQNIVNYFRTYKGHHQYYFFVYCACELLGFVCTVVNIIITDSLLAHQFLSYGSDVVSYWLHNDPSSNDVSPMIKVFPLMAKCSSPRRYGPSGNIIAPDPVCILPLNSLNDKIYLFLWFYLIFVLLVSALSFMYRLCTIFFKKFRFILLKQKSGQLKFKILEDLCDRCHVGDWFVMYIMNKNVSNIFFQEFLEIYWEDLLSRKLSV